MKKWIVSTPLKGTNLMKNFVCFTEVELRKLLERYPDASVEMKDSHLEDHAPLPLTDDQHVVLEWLKKKYKTTDIEPIELIWRLRVNSNSDKWRLQHPYKNYRYLTEIAQFQVLAAFAEWGMKNDQED